MVTVTLLCDGVIDYFSITNFHNLQNVFPLISPLESSHRLGDLLKHISAWKVQAHQRPRFRWVCQSYQPNQFPRLCPSRINQFSINIVLKDKHSIGFHLMNNKRMANEVYYSGPDATLIYTVCPLCCGVMAECQERHLIPTEEAWKGLSAGGNLRKDAPSFRKLSQRENRSLSCLGLSSGWNYGWNNVKLKTCFTLRRSSCSSSSTDLQ